MNRLAFIKSCGATLLATAAGITTSQAKEKKPDPKDTHVFDFPNPVQKTVLDFAGDGTIQEITKKRLGAKSWLYVVKYSRKGQTLVLTTSEAGRLIRIENAEEEPVKKPDKVEKSEAKPKAEPSKAVKVDSAETQPATVQSANPGAAESRASQRATDATWDETGLDDMETDTDDDDEVDDSDNEDSPEEKPATSEPANNPPVK